MSRHPMLWVMLAYILYILYLISLPIQLFNEPNSTVLVDKHGQLLSAQIAADEQWRLPLSDTIPWKFIQCLIHYEDKRFFQHIGFDPIAMLRAAWLNLKNHKIVSGGSTLTMQVIRLSRKNKRRTFFEKVVETILATRLELKYSKADILKLYVAHAPFGGNVVGLESASWRYFNKPSSLLSWGEAATLAILPNSPALIHPGKNRSALLKKRNDLLKLLSKRKVIDEYDRDLALAEPLPEAPLTLPSHTPHLLSYLKKVGKTGRIKTSLDFNIQLQLNDLANAHCKNLKFLGIHNLAILVIDIQTNQVVAYVGNCPQAGKDHGQFVDIIQAPRSSGSILKPILYAAALSDGEILPQSLLTDIPMTFSGYQPNNYLSTYDGVVPADKALARSLNVPFVQLLQQYGVPRFHSKLQQVGLTTLTNPPEHYGLSLILGGAECTLWDITNTYAGMARVLNNHYEVFKKKTLPNPFTKASILFNESIEPNPTRSFPLTPDAIHFTFQAMKEVVRPNEEGDWKRFEAERRIAWKTGTSYGFKDAWAVGVDSRFAVGVWVGNADGEGRPGLIGIHTAAPVLFDTFKKLPVAKDWFAVPYDEMEEVIVCSSSGFLANEFCPRDTVLSIKRALNTRPCPFHKRIFLSKNSKYRLDRVCHDHWQSAQSHNWFILPPAEEYYYRKKHPEYLPPPPFHPLCNGTNDPVDNPLELLYPNTNTVLIPPKELDGRTNLIVLEASHRDANAVVFWHLDNNYLGSTKEIHTMEVMPTEGKHQIVIFDESGNMVKRWVEIKLN